MRDAGAAMRGLIVAAAIAPAAGVALEVRTNTEGEGGPVTVEAGTTVNDSLIAIGSSVVVDGVVDGDLVAFAREVVVRGTVMGDVLTAAESVSIEGSVAGNVLGFGRSVEALEGRIDRNLYGFGQRVLIGRGARIGGDATMFAETSRMSGTVGRDVLGFARELELGGEVARNVGFFGEEARVLPGADVGGDLTLHVPREANARVADGATVAGKVVTDVRFTRERPNRFLRPGFYGFEIARLAAAFIIGWIVFALAPSLAGVQLGAPIEMLKTGGLGLLAIVATPIAALLVAFTLIGLPLAVIAIFVWLTALYLAKIVVAGYVGDRLLERADQPPRRPLALLVGLVVVLVAVALPWIGGLVHIVLTALGMGVLIRFAAAHARAPRAVAPSGP
jgi:cytoskeletal protein CcmA (bactofilin family)